MPPLTMKLPTAFLNSCSMVVNIYLFLIEKENEGFRGKCKLCITNDESFSLKGVNSTPVSVMFSHI